ncbi:transmembrane protein 18-like [Mercenaria mercenaria]|uniref:transmembrane protein 18-like n=1 Tax=Mercenaria mercenaria TaxID=6596 RepID=UPI00234E5B67|nr:transmembrane protein 18-like [Mercenaria mercenaria]
MADDSRNDFRGPINPIRVNEIDGLIKYLQSINWTEPWFCGLAAFHLTCAILTVLTRNKGVLQAIYFSVLMILVFCAEYINEWAAKNFKLFASEQYFDSNGLFISIVFSMPLLMNCLVIVISWLWDVGMLIHNVKQLKIKQRSRQAEKQKGKDAKEESTEEETEQDSQENQDSEDKKEK